MQANKRVLIIGFDPKFLDFSSPELAPLNLTAEKINAGTAAEMTRLRDLGYEPEGCFVDLARLQSAPWPPASEKSRTSA